MTRCPKCGQGHRGPRTADVLIAEGSRMLALALDSTGERALRWLRTQWMSGALEIDGVCANCILTTVASSLVAVEVVHEADAQLAAIAEDPIGRFRRSVQGDQPGFVAGPAHVAQVIPFPRAKRGK